MRPAAKRAHRLLVERFRGPTNSANVARAAVVAALEAENSVDVVSVRALDPFKESLDGSPRGYAGAIRQLDLHGIVRGKLTRTDGGYRLRVSLVGSDGKTREDIIYENESVAGLRQEVQRSLWLDLYAQFDAPAPAAPRRAEQEARDSAPEVERQQEDEDEEREPASQPKSSPQSPPRRVPRCARWQPSVEAGAARRTFKYDNERPGPLRGYDSTAFPLLAATLGIFPFADGDCAGWSGLGVEGRFEYLLAPDSRLANQRLSTRALSAQAELLYRPTFGFFWFEPRAGYSARRFELQGQVVADAVYNALRVGLRSGIHPGPFRLDIGGSFDWVLSAEQLMLSDWFPDAKGFGYELRARVGWAFGEQLELLLVGRQVRYIFELNPGGAHPYLHGIADRAHDQYLSGSLEARWIMR